MKFIEHKNTWYLNPEIWGNWLIRESYSEAFEERPIEAQVINRLFWEGMKHYNYYLRSLSLTYDRASEIIDLYNEADYYRTNPIEYISTRKQVSKGTAYNWIKALTPVINLDNDRTTLEEDEKFEISDISDYSIIDIHNTSVSAGTIIECAGSGISKNWHESEWELSHLEIDFVAHKGCLSKTSFPKTLCANCFEYFHQAPIPKWLHYRMNEIHKEYKNL